MGIDEIRQLSRTALHRGMQRPAFYYDPKTLLPVPCLIRVHTKFEAKGDVQGTSFRFAERKEETPKAIFLRADGIRPQQYAVLMLSAEEGYRINNVDKPYRETVTVALTELPTKELADYLYPSKTMISIYGRIDLPGFGEEEDTDLPGLDIAGTGVMFIYAIGDIILPDLE